VLRIIRASLPLGPCCVIAFLGVLEGCGPARPVLLPASGIVSLDGKPLPDAAVMFHPTSGGRPATGVTDVSGKFVLGTFKPRDGALPGSHTVTIACREETSPGDVRWIAPEIYSLADQSGLSADVAKGSLTFNFDLSSSAQHTK